MIRLSKLIKALGQQKLTVDLNARRGEAEGLVAVLGLVVLVLILIL